MSLIKVEAKTQHINVNPATGGVTVINAGPPGPRGFPGADGAPGSGTVDSVARDLIATHIMDPTPHPSYDDLPDLSLIFENGLI